MAAVNGRLLDMLAAIARKDYTDRRRRQADGIAKAKTEGAYKGRREGAARNAAIVVPCCRRAWHGAKFRRLQGVAGAP